MVRILGLALAFSSLLVGSQIYAAPASEIVARQIGNLQCNIDRLSIVAGLAKTQSSLKTLSKDFASDNSTAASVQSVIDNVTGAQGAIGVIAKALLTGQTAPAEARDQVKGNITAALGTLSAINSTDTTAAADLTKALSALTKSAKSGQGVVDNCK